MAVWQYRNKTGAEAYVFVDDVLAGKGGDGKDILFNAEGTQKVEVYRSEGNWTAKDPVLEESPVEAGRVDERAEHYS